MWFVLFSLLSIWATFAGSLDRSCSLYHSCILFKTSLYNICLHSIIYTTEQQATLRPLWSFWNI